MRPRRQIEWTNGYGWTISDSDKYSQDRELAEKIRDELDVVDPLPCPHTGDKVELTTFAEMPGSRVMCVDCGETRREDEW